MIYIFFECLNCLNYPKKSNKNNHV
jgi:hypothetical protein